MKYFNYSLYFFKNFKIKQKYIDSEIEIVLKLDHPNVVRINEVFSDVNFIHIVMEYLEGGNLEKYFNNKTIIDEKKIAYIFY